MYRARRFDVLGKRVSVGVAWERGHSCLRANRHAMFALVMRKSVDVIICHRRLVHPMYLGRRLLLLLNGCMRGFVCVCQRW